MCTIPPNPPADLNIVPPEPPANVSNREALAEHTMNPACSGCHEVMDPIGFGFENFDAVGRWRATDGGRPVDDRGRLVSTEDIDGPFRGAIELSGKLAGSSQVRACVVSTVIGFAHAPQVAADACVQSKMLTAFEAAKHDIRELIVAVTGTDGFQYRLTLAGEVSP